MRTLSIFFLFVVVLVLSCSQEPVLMKLVDQTNSLTIAVDLADYSSASEAADAYLDVNWLDNNKSDDDICRTALAAVELQSYLCNMLNISKDALPIVNIKAAPQTGNVIFIGMPPVTKHFKGVYKKVARAWKSNGAEEQSFRLDTFFVNKQKVLVISGHSSIGCLYGTYEFLDNLGVRWISPKQGGEIVPQLQQLAILSEHTQINPYMLNRGFWLDNTIPDTLITPELFQWMGRNRLNLFRNVPQLTAFAKQRGILFNTGRMDIYDTLLRASYPYRYNHPEFEGDQSLPIDPFLTSEYYQGDANKDRTLSYWEAHPDWFIEKVDSTALADTAISKLQICLSNLDAVEEFSHLVADKLSFGEWQNCDIIDLWAPEVWSPQNSKQNMGNDADKLLFLVYHVQQAIKAAREKNILDRDIQIHAYAHHYSRQLPEVQLPTDFDTSNIMIYLYTGPRCYNHYIIDANCMNINFWFSKALVDWLSKENAYHGNIGVLENYNAPYYGNLPTVFYESMRLDLPAYKELGVRGLSYRNYYVNDKGVEPLINYQFARQIWNSDLEAEQIKKEFMQNYYGPVADSMDNVYTKLGVSMRSISTWRYFMPLQLQSFTDSVLAKTNETMLHLNERFEKQTEDAETNFNQLWDQTYSYIFEARYALDEVLQQPLAEPYLSRVKNVDRQLRYAEVVISVYDNIIYFLTLGNEDLQMRDEAVFRMRENAAILDSLTVPFSPTGKESALQDTGIESVTRKIISEYKFSQTFEE